MPIRISAQSKPHPLLYEINTRCWLHQLSQRSGRRISLANIPESEFDQWQEFGFTHIWLMGVWSTGELSRAVALADENLRREYSIQIPKETISGSPYAIAGYCVSRRLGGEQGLAQFRRALHARGMKLILDFVPNHVGLDHPWVEGRPELFVQAEHGGAGFFQRQTTTGARWFAHGRDPNFPPWTDTVQLDYRKSATRLAMQDELLSIASRCDGVRCDMAMLVLNDVFARTWAAIPLSHAPDAEFWSDAIAAAKRVHPDFLFLAEVYWDLEAKLQALGFDYTYDKVLYDEIVRRNPAGAQKHLLEAPSHFIERSAHFLENHDEVRIASILSPAEHRAAALLILALPGMRLLHQGQLTGRRVKLPVQFAGCFEEPNQPEIKELYRQLFSALKRTVVGRGDALILKPNPVSPENRTAENFVVIQWQAGRSEFDLAVINLAARRSQCFAPLQIEGLADHHWRMEDLLGPERYEWNGADFRTHGLYLDVPGHAAQLFHFSRIA